MNGQEKEGRGNGEGNGGRPIGGEERDRVGKSDGSSSPELNTSSSDSLEESDNGGEKSKKRKGSSKKLDRSKLRKGKWTVEEEEYTSRIIHYFSTGLLTLPEGATLRSYLADKLNCDPMRITKKYAGASCLGRRAYQFRERIRPTMADIQLARTELDHLEQRFRMRVEGDTGGQFVQRSPNISQSLVQPSAPMLVQNPVTAQNPLQNILLGLLGAQNAQIFPPQILSAVGSTGGSQPQCTQTAIPSFVGAGVTGQPIPTQPLCAPHFAAPIAPTPAPQIHHILPSQAAAPPVNSTMSQVPGDVNFPQGAIDPTLANWALLQAAASLGPALSQLAAANIQAQTLQRQQVPQPQPQAQQIAPQPQAINNTLIFQPQTTLQHTPVSSNVSAAPAPHSQTTQMQAQQLQIQIQEQQAKLQQQLLQLNAASAASQAHMKLSSPVIPPANPQVQNSSQAPAATNPTQHQPTPTVGSIKIDSSSPAPATSQFVAKDGTEHFTKDLKQAYDLHLKSQQKQQDAMAKAEKATLPVTGYSPFANLGMASGILGNVSTLPQQTNSSNPRTDEDRAAGTALLGFLSSLRQSYEDALREQHGGATGSSDSSDENRAATITDSNAGSNQPDSSVEDSDWNSDKKTDPSSSEESDTPGKLKGRPSKRQKQAVNEV